MDMTTEMLEKRLKAVENEVAGLKQRLSADKSQNSTVSWKRIFGSFANSEGFEEAVRLGRDYRESFRVG
jgi:hypothetical protein